MAEGPTRATIVAGGEMLHTGPITDSALVVAADSGYDHALARSLAVDVLVGDLDSISPAGLDHARMNDVVIEEHPRDKDATDLELAIRTAIGRGAEAIDLYGGESGRVGHFLGVALATTHPDWATVPIAWHTAGGVVRSALPEQPASFTASINDTVTILPLGDAHGVTTTGLRWQLDDATLTRGTSRGVSNTMVAETVTVTVREGAVLVIQEGPDSA